MINQSIRLTLVDGARVVVPDSLNLITPYVLREQEDWFEDEIKFLRRLLQPGQKIVDIGANYGVYTLSMAQAVGPSGHIWSFEPASGTASFLAEGIAANGFTHVTLERSALSSKSGTAQLSLNPNSELNSLVREDSMTANSETVHLVTLDQCLDKYGWQDIGFMKIDAEGEEANILKGGERFFSMMSPLILYEVKVESVVHLDLVQAFAGMGYESYRLVPGLNLLVPFDVKSKPDGFLLNLFCCKPDCAARLAARGLLLESLPVLKDKSQQAFNAGAPNKTASSQAYNWRHTIAKLPYGAQLVNQWGQTVASGRSGEVIEALSCYARSQDASLPMAERFAALESSLNRFVAVCERQPSHLRLASLARVALDYGARNIAVNALSYLSNSILQTNNADTSEPFLAPGKRFDSIPPGNIPGNWVLAAVLEEYERVIAFSSYYTGLAARQRLEFIRDLGFGSAEMQRRLSLLMQRLSLNTPKPVV